ncbi:MAG: hypothetical protein R2851_16790 [Caldilineaceae bacterium]
MPTLPHRSTKAHPFAYVVTLSGRPRHDVTVTLASGDELVFDRSQVVRPRTGRTAKSSGSARWMTPSTIRAADTYRLCAHAHRQR